MDSPDPFDAGEAFFGDSKRGFGMSGTRLINHLVVHVDIVEKIVFVSLVVHGMINDVYRYGFIQTYRRGFVGSKNFANT